METSFTYIINFRYIEHQNIHVLISQAMNSKDVLRWNHEHQFVSVCDYLQKKWKLITIMNWRYSCELPNYEENGFYYLDILIVSTNCIFIILSTAYLPCIQIQMSVYIEDIQVNPL